MSLFFDNKEDKKVKELRLNEEEEVARILSDKYGIGYIDLSGVSINTDALRLVPEAEAMEGNLAVFKIVGKKLSVAVKNPENEITKKVLHSLTEKDYEVSLFMTSNQSLQKAWTRYRDISFATETKAGTLDISNEVIEKLLAEVKSIVDITRLVGETVSEQKVYRTSKIISIIIAGAIATNASDIHLEPEEEITRLRFRLDGVLIDVINLDKDTYQPMLSRLKLLSNLKLNIKENAQDGRFSVKIYNDDIEIRTSVLPGAYGESIVMRLLNPKAIQVSFDSLGIPDKLRKIFEKEIGKPDGIILNTGPTGSGKTTTLYSFLRKVHTSEIKIVTIEDPIEYHLPGIVQTQTDNEKGYDFATGLKSILRQDPDVILVGEIRDGETAEIAMNAALTGHLVFSTLHTNNAAGTFPRLVELGVNPKIIPSAINVAIAQRLVRKVCTKCAKRIKIPENRKALIDRVIKNIIKKGDEVLQTDEIFESVGCDDCNHTGYKGRIATYEAIFMDKIIEEIIYQNPSEREIAKAANHQNILTLQEDGITKVLGGVTTLDELERVIDLSVAEKLYDDLESEPTA